MKKFYSLFLMMTLSISAAFAQGELITKVSEFSNSKAYTVTSSRCFIQVIDGGDRIYSSTGTVAGINPDPNESDAKQQFAFINGGKNFYLYSVGAGKFVKNDGTLTESASDDVVINIVETSDSNHPLNLNWGDDKYFNTQESGKGWEYGYTISDWNTIDAGNRFAIIEAADFTDAEAIQKAKAHDDLLITDSVTYVYMCDGQQAYTYTKVAYGIPPVTVTYDDPAARVGVTCSDETPASKEITENTCETVIYNYVMDMSTLPFAPTTIADGKFGDGTKWYYLQPSNSDKFCYTTEDDNKMYYADKGGVHPIDLHYMYAFTGNPLSGFQIYNYSKGAEKPIKGVESSYEVTFEEGSLCKYFLETGNSDGQYRFNQTTNADSYLNAYSNEIELYTWAGYSSTDAGSQFYIAEVSEKELEKAINGVLAYDPSYANNTIFHNGDPISTLQILFTGVNDEGIAIAEGMADGKITLVDTDGNVVATPKYAVNAEDPTLLDIVFDPEFNTEGSYKVIIPDNLVIGTVSGMPNTEIGLTYIFMNVFEEKTVTARIWKTQFDGYSSYYYPTWTSLPYATHDDGEYYTCKIKVTGKDSFVLLDWMNAGGEKDTLKVQFNPDKTTSNGISFNDKELDEYESSWIYTSTILDPAGYKGAYFYPTYSDISMDDEYGRCVICGYTYDSSYAYNDYYVYTFVDWYLDDRYAMLDIIDAKIYASAFKELDYTDAENPAFSQLPYDKTTGTYDITVGVKDESTIVVRNYTGANEDLTIVYDPSDGSVISFNGETADDYGTAWITSSVLDGTSYGGWYAYTGSYSTVSYDPDTKSGYIIISGLDYSLGSYYGDYRYLYISIGDYTPTTAIKSVNASANADGKVTVYSVAGQRISSPRKGVNIINGKKVKY